MNVTRRQAAGVLTAAVLAAPANVRGDDQPMAKGLRVVTYNIRYENSGDGPDGWQHRRAAMAKYLAETKADMVGLQEVLIGQLKYLADQLPDYAWHGVGRDDGRERGELSPLLYRRERFEVQGRGTFWLSTMPKEVGSKGWDAALPRVCSWLKLYDRVAKRDVLALNTHFDHRGREARNESARLIRQQVDELAGEAKAMPVVLTGDFNCTAADEPYRTIVGDDPKSAAAVRDAYGASTKPPAGPDSTWNGFGEIVPKRKIDFIFVRDLAVAEHRIDDPRVGSRFVSDHLPIVADLQYE